MDLQKERELFLAHMRSIGSAGFMFELDEDGNFDDMSMAYAWSAWQTAKAQAVPEWISVEDSLPEFDVPVLATNMKFQEGKFWWIFERCDSDDGWVWSRFESSLNEAYCDDYEITHWMPLPAVLKAQEPAK